ncbi:MAG: FtsX-like permease family protein, partial [Wenzhouxiangellaceae bacterium]
ELLGRPGDGVLELRIAGQFHRVGISTIVDGQPGLDRRLLMEIGEAQKMTAMQGRISELLAPQDSGDWLSARLGEDLLLIDAAARRTSAGDLTRGMRANLTAMSLLALATGLFVVYSVLSFLLVQRRARFGLLRALGMTHPMLARMLIGEVVLIAALGGLLGLVAGTLLADRLLLLVAPPVAEVYGRFAPVSTQPSMLLYAGIWGLGILSALAVTAPVLREALTIPPGRILRSAGARRWPISRVLALSSVLVVAGTAWILLDPRLIAGLGGLFLVLAGLVVLVPAAGFGLVGLVAGLQSGKLAGRALRLLESARGRLSPALAALSLALALAIGMGMMILGFRATVGDWVERLLRADLYVSQPGRPLVDEQLEHIGALPGVRVLSSIRRLELVDGTHVTAYRLPAEAWWGFEFIAGDGDAAWPLFERGEAVILSEPYARANALSAGDRLVMISPGGPVSLPVAAVFRDYSSEQGFVAISRELYRRWVGDGMHDSVGIYLEPGMEPEQLLRELPAVGLDDPQWYTPASIQRETLAVFDRTFRISWALALLVGLIALVALTSALLAQGLERAREYATLRALGLPPGRLLRLVTIQSTGLTAAALATALPLAVLIHLALSLVVQPRAFGWSLPVALPPMEPVALVVPVALLLGTLTGIYPAWRIGQRPVSAHLRADR